MKLRQLFALFLIIALVSFLGFCVENIWLAMTKGYMNNRNMRLPFLLGYGLAIVAIYAMFGTPQAPRLFTLAIPIQSKFLRIASYYLIVCLCVMVGEIALGTFVEKTCGIVWWNYSQLPLHITKYTSVPTTLAFGFLITVFMGCFFTPAYTYFSGTSSKLLAALACGLMLLMVIDFIHSGIAMYAHGALLETWKIDLSDSRIHKFWLALQAGA